MSYYAEAAELERHVDSVEGRTYMQVKGITRDTEKNEANADCDSKYPAYRWTKAVGVGW